MSYICPLLAGRVVQVMTKAEHGGVGGDVGGGEGCGVEHCEGSVCHGSRKGTPKLMICTRLKVDAS